MSARWKYMQGGALVYGEYRLQPARAGSSVGMLRLEFASQKKQHRCCTGAGARSKGACASMAP